MGKTLTILLLSLMLIPLCWNGMSFMHYLVEHTHTLCANEKDHQHPSAEDCHTICHIAPQQDQGPVPNKVEFYELKQYVTVFSCFDKQYSFSNAISTYSAYSLLYGRILLEDIFRPPIS